MHRLGAPEPQNNVHRLRDDIMKYEEFIEKLKENPKKFKDVIKSEYSMLRQEINEFRRLTVILLNFMLGLGELLGM